MKSANRLLEEAGVLPELVWRKFERDGKAVYRDGALVASYRFNDWSNAYVVTHWAPDRYYALSETLLLTSKHAHQRCRELALARRRIRIG
jgi:hypothetical protein